MDFICLILWIVGLAYNSESLSNTDVSFKCGMFGLIVLSSRTKMLKVIKIEKNVSKKTPTFG